MCGALSVCVRLCVHVRRVTRPKHKKKHIGIHSAGAKKVAWPPS